MTAQEKIDLALKEAEQAELMINASRAAVKSWTDAFDLRSETLARLRAENQPPRKKVKNG